MNRKNSSSAEKVGNQCSAELLMYQHTSLDEPLGKLCQTSIGLTLNRPLNTDGFPMRSIPQWTSEPPVISHPETRILGATFWK